MKVILLQDVARIGRRFEVRDVPQGHALNFLIPRKLAERATAENMKRTEARKASAAAKTEEGESALAALVEKLAGTTVEMPVEANEQGHLFKGIKAADIAGFVSAAHGTLPESALDLAQPIKELGMHEIPVMVGSEPHTFTLNVVKK